MPFSILNLFFSDFLMIHHPPINKELLKQLSKPNDAVACSHIIIRVSGEAFLFFGVIYCLPVSWCLSFLFFYLSAIWHSFWGYAGISHELMHARVFSIKKTNLNLFILTSYLSWNNPAFFRKSHRFHHQFIFDEQDEEGHSFQNWSFFAIVSYLTIDIQGMLRRLFYVLINALGFFLYQRKLKRLDWAYQKHACLMIIFHAMFQYILWLFFHNPYVNILFFLLPFAGQFINRLLAQSQHIGLKQWKKEGALKNSRTVILPKWLEFLYAGMNFHAIHHLYPYIPYYNLGKLNDELVKKCLVTNIDWKFFFFYEVWRLISIEKKNSCS